MSKFISKLKLAICIGLASFVVACGGSDEGGDREIKTAALSGKVSGQAWTVQTAIARLSSDGSYSFELHGDVLTDPCGFTPSSVARSFVIFSYDGTPIDVPLKFDFSNLEASRTVTFVTDDGNSFPNNTVISSGRLKVEAPADGKIKGGLNVGSGDDHLDGAFTATICE